MPQEVFSGDMTIKKIGEFEEDRYRMSVISLSLARLAPLSAQ